jgi:SAM-dependent methyltransferase
VRPSLAALRRTALTQLRHEGVMPGLRKRYLALIRRHAITHAENLQKLNDWVGYVFYCRLLATLVPDRDAFIVDWGGLYGHVTAILRALGYTRAHNYILGEGPAYSDFRIRLALPTICGTDPNRLALDESSVDVLVSSGVLEHVGADGPGDEATALRDIHRVLRPGGWFVCWNLPNEWSLTELLAKASGRYHHPRCYDRLRIGRALGAAGFNVVAAEKHTLLPGTLMRRLEWLGSPAQRFALDDALSRLPVVRTFARDWIVLARRPGDSAIVRPR